jgi:hypothetical protein
MVIMLPEEVRKEFISRTLGALDGGSAFPRGAVSLSEKWKQLVKGFEINPPGYTAALRSEGRSGVYKAAKELLKK